MRKKFALLNRAVLAEIVFAISAHCPARAQTAQRNQTDMAPAIVADTTTDSPGTNLVTRIVTIKADIRGIPPLFLQWKVDHGGGFVPVSANATNPVLVILNAKISDSGRYALFATNSVAGTNSTPVSLVVVEGRD
jgi:hypothetical protein